MKTPEQQPEIKAKAAAWTIGVHALLLIMFFLVGYTLPAPQPAEEFGMEVNLGTSNEGSGTDQPMSVDDPASGDISAVYKSSAKTHEEARDIMRSDDPDAPAVAPTSGDRGNHIQTNASRNRNNQQQTNANSNRPQTPRYVYNGASGRGGNSASTNQPGTNEGNTTGNGDRGVPGGTPGAANYEGSPGNGTGGISHTLSGRDIYPRTFTAEFREGGKVVIHVTVDRDGNIIGKSIKSSPSATLSRLAMQKLSESKFTKSPDAAPQQFGDVTFLFKTRK